MRAKAEIYVDREPQFLGCYRKGMSRFGELLCASFFPTVGVAASVGAAVVFHVLLSKLGLGFVGIILMVVMPFFVFYACVRCSLVYPIIVVENVSACKGLQRSWELSQEAFCEIFGAFFSFALLRWTVASMLQIISVGTNLAALLEPAGIVLSVVSHQLPNLCFVPCFAM